MNEKIKNEIPAERRARILEFLKGKGIVRVDELSESLHVSVITIRRDLTILEDEGLLERTHGGAISTSLQIHEPSFFDKDKRNIPLKMSIARKAASLVGERETVLVNSGSTTALVLKELMQKKNLTIITNNIGALTSMEIVSDCELIVTGGTLRAGTSCLVGEEVLNRLDRVHPTTSIIGIDGFSFKMGLTSHNTHEAAVSRKMINQTTRGKVIVVADSSKLGNLSQHNVGTMADIDILITDALPDLSVVNDFENAGIILITTNG
ncbi:MAG: DeoR/GlpR family DNA-binding transcription regulator [Spirochaetaceae bacterium]|jgi:DeoR/GlpR family transcriptional regulator of sugar metabolism|nr:DeoR/GlpR family DNA-binding transcription regulator [Spirochaetaceae bacterium]